MIKHPVTGVPCDEVVYDKKVKFSGYKTSTVILLNPRKCKIERIKVDDCAIIDGRRCDWMARTFGENAEEIFIELKSASRISKPVEQLEETIKKLSSGIPDLKKTRKRCLIVCRAIGAIQTQLQIYKSKFKSNFNAILQTVKPGAEVLIDNT
jgi:hypothetical protein